MASDPVEGTDFATAHLDVGDGAGIGALPNGVLGVIEDFEADPAGALQCIHESRDGPVAPASDPTLVALDA